MKLSESAEILKKSTPDYFKHSDWLTNAHCLTVHVLFLEGITAAIDKSEVEGKTDDEVKKLVQERIVTALQETITQVVQT